MKKILSYFAFAIIGLSLVLAPSIAEAKKKNVVKVQLIAEETEWKYDNQGSTMTAFTFNGTIPGPVIRVTEGDIVEFELVNNTKNKKSHSIDFHAARVDVLKQFSAIKPGEKKTFSFPATTPGVFYYHCGANPMHEHIARGMFGVIIVDPKKDKRPKPDREYVLVQSEIYDKPDQLIQDRATNVVFNGRAFRYDPVHDEKASGNVMMAKPGERVRIYFANAGPHNFSAFHPIAGIWDKVWLSGNPKNELTGMQTVNVGPGDAVTVDLISPVEGGNAIVTHSLKDAMTGAIAVIVFQNKLNEEQDALGKNGNYVVK